MVDWERVEVLRAKDWDWARIAADPTVGFHPDPSAGEPGPALRALYHRGGTHAKLARTAGAVSDRPEKREGKRWPAVRIGYLLVGFLGLWFLLAYAVPSPVGLLLPAIPYLALVLLGTVAFFLLALWRWSGGHRWSPLYRKTLVWGIALGVVVSGMVGLVAVLVFGCPYLPSAATQTGVGPSGWYHVNAAPWQENGRPVLFFYGATWCPYCSASSWAIWKSISLVGATVPPTSFSSYSSASDSPSSIPEVVLAGAQPSATLALAIAEDTSGVRDTAPVTSSCIEQAYVSAYSPGGAIPFVVVNGQYLHVGTIVQPTDLSPWAAGANGGDTAVRNSVETETAAPSGGNPWQIIESVTWWMVAIVAKATGVPIATLASEYGWSAADRSSVAADYAQIS